MISKTVYLLGAGASKELFGLPVMNEFFKNFSVKKYESLSKFLSEYFFNGLKNQDLENEINKSDKLNLEDVITFLELGLNRMGSFGKVPDSYLIEARNDSNKLIRDMLDMDYSNRITEISEKIKIFEKLSKRSDISQCTDSIISLNYDLGFDNILYNFSDRNSLRPNSVDHRTILGRMYEILGRGDAIFADFPTYKNIKDSGFFLKLHGSLNWVYCQNEYCDNNRQFFGSRIWLPESQFNADDICILCGSPLVPVIIPPTLAKSFEQFPKMGFIWSLAYRELCKADNIVIFGISFAPSDYYLRWLLRSAVANRNNDQKPKIKVIDINRDVYDEVEKITGVKPDFKVSFEEYLDSLN